MTALQHLRATIWVHDKVDISFLAMLEHLETLHLKVSYSVCRHRPGGTVVYVCCWHLWQRSVIEAQG